MFNRLNKKNSKQLLDFSDPVDDVLTNDESKDNAESKLSDNKTNLLKILNSKHKKKNEKVQSLSQIQGGEEIFKDPGFRAYVEIWGSNSLNSKRLFALGIVCAIGMVYMGIQLSNLATTKTATPILVEYNGLTGEYKKPVVIEKSTATTSMAKYALGKWAEYVFTVDPKISLEQYKLAASMTAGRGVGQYTDYRVQNDVIAALSDGNKLLIAKTRSVDILQSGVAIVHIEQTEYDNRGSMVLKNNYRVRLDYSLEPPTDADQILRNPIGLVVEGFTYDLVK